MIALATPRDAAASLAGEALTDSPEAAARRLPRRRRRVSALTVFWVVIVAILVLPIALFLAVAFSPALLSQGPQWFTLDAFRQALTGQLLTGVVDSLGVGVSTAVLSAAIGFALAWLVLRTNAPGRRIATGLVFALLLAPSYLIALGWERLLEPNGVLAVLGVPDAGLRATIYGPVGVVVVLTMKGIPFAFLAIANAVRGLGDEFQDALRVHGGGRAAALRLNVAMLAPAIWAALAIVFAESVSDFGVASTLANDSHFVVATYTLYTAVEAFPVDFPVASAVSWVLLVLVALALLAQGRALRGRSFRVLGGRSRPASRARLGVPGALTAALFVGVVAVVGVGVPAFGAVSASLISNLGSLGAHSVTLGNYTRVLTSPDLLGPLKYSAILATVTASVTVVMATVCARLLAASGATASGRILDLVLLGAVALPGIVFAAGYIFAYNLPLTNALGIHLYGTTTLLVLAYIATALPSTSRVLVGTMGQLQESMTHASRVHGSGAARAWATIVLPIVSRPLLSAWLLTFTATLLELPVSQLLAPAGTQPVSVGIDVALGKYDFGGATAMEVLAILFALAVVGAGYALYRLAAPVGWRTLGKAR
ncbi:ABC transporter permease [Frondihabitans australicus]|uniref:Iron(III) transport system permease protein n=1 Tax=Frondihabitans australicus TaxID=386892 RepID=A0A495IBQ3_9MICO|nr:iron ABC transporter permease [Frondihabitans australicus]RKR73349.1 iron(III) transport system permease protein [Frondihabitans australicus]